MKLQDVILKAMAKKLTWMAAAEIAGMSVRNMQRKREAYQRYGYDGLFDQRRGKFTSSWWCQAEALIHHTYPSLTVNTRCAILVLAERDEDPAGSITGYPGPDGAENARSMGPIARLRHCAADPAGLAGPSGPERGYALSGAVTPGQRRWIRSEWGVSENNRKAKYYSLTKPGRKQLREETAGWHRMATIINRLLQTAG